MRKKQKEANSQKCDKKALTTWAMLIRIIFEVDPLDCPKCGRDMKIVTIIDRHQKDVVKKILKHCNIWKDPDPPPNVTLRTLAEAELEFEDEVTYDSDFFDMIT